MISTQGRHPHTQNKYSNSVTVLMFLFLHFYIFDFLREGRDIWSRWFCGYRRIMTLLLSCFLNKMCHKTVCGNLCSFKSNRKCSLIGNVPFINTRWQQHLNCFKCSRLSTSTLSVQHSLKQQVLDNRLIKAFIQKFIKILVLIFTL